MAEHAWHLYVIQETRGETDLIESHLAELMAMNALFSDVVTEGCRSSYVI